MQKLHLANGKHKRQQQPLQTSVPFIAVYKESFITTAWQLQVRNIQMGNSQFWDRNLVLFTGVWLRPKLHKECNKFWKTERQISRTMNSALFHKKTGTGPGGTDKRESTTSWDPGFWLRGQDLKIWCLTMAAQTANFSTDYFLPIWGKKSWDGVK